MSTREQIIEKIQKLQRLADTGVGGERTNAKAAVDAMMKKYNITPEEIQEDEERYFTFFIEGIYCNKLFRQVSAVLGIKKCGFLQGKRLNRELRCELEDIARGKKYNVVFETTPSKFIELTTLYDIYQKSLEDQFKVFYYAFLDTNDLLLKPDSDDQKELTKEEYEKLRKAMMMAASIDKASVYKRIEKGGEK